MPRLFPGFRHAGALVLVAAAGAAVASAWPSGGPAPVVAPPAALRAAQAPAPPTLPPTGGLAPDGAGALAAARPPAPRDAFARLGEHAPAPPVRALTGYGWPLARGRITLPFEAIPGGTWLNAGHRFHDGIDLATFCGDRVVAAHAGVVLAAGRHYDDVLGWIGDLRPYYALLDRRHMWPDLPLVVVVDDGNGYRSVYAHFERVTVHAGQPVRAGQLIGYEGATGHASGCHVHYGLFSPAETAAFGSRPDVMRRLHVPAAEIARIDPILVLPGGAAALRSRRVPTAADLLAAATRVDPVRRD